MKIIIRRAAFDDIEDIHQILKQFANEDLILERSREDIAASIDNFIVAENIGEVAGVIAYHDYGMALKEVRSLAVKKHYSRRGIGTNLLVALIESLLNNFPDARIFALSYYPDFFKKSGFVEISKSSLPQKIWKDCKNCKNRENCGEKALIFSKKEFHPSKIR